MTIKRTPLVILSVVVGLTAAGLVTAGIVAASQDESWDPGPVGYDNTPYLPGGEWRVHDKDRPVPPIIQPGVGNAPPSDAVVLFDGKDLSGWQAANGDAARWRVTDGYMEVNGTGSIQTRESFGDCQLHIEWASPAALQGDSQGRGNSGVFLMSRYEVQVLDSYQNRTYADGQASSLYGQTPPLVNACRGPGEWQTYDIIFTAPKFEDGALVSKAVMTVLHNGVITQHAQELLGATTHQKVAAYSPHCDAAPIQLQDHGNPVHFRNIWIRKL